MSASAPAPAARSRPYTKLDVFLFPANLIGYSRVVFAFVSLCFMRWHPKVCTVFYCLSCVLDALDGAVARRMGQTSRFGAILDMVTDRCTTSSLICYLCIAYPQWVVAFQLLISLDLASHYMHMYASMVEGSTSHKKVGSDSKLLHLYYSNNKVLFTICAANELFFIGLYLYSFPLRSPPNLGYIGEIPLSYATLILVSTFPLWALKQIINVVQLHHAAVHLATGDARDRNLALAAKAK